MGSVDWLKIGYPSFWNSSRISWFNPGSWWYTRASRTIPMRSSRSSWSSVSRDFFWISFSY